MPFFKAGGKVRDFWSGDAHNDLDHVFCICKGSNPKDFNFSQKIVFYLAVCKLPETGKRPRKIIFGH